MILYDFICDMMTPSNWEEVFLSIFLHESQLDKGGNYTTYEDKC